MSDSNILSPNVWLCLLNLYNMSQKSSTSYFAKYFRAGLTDCKNFNGYRVRDNMRTQVCNQCFNF